MTVSHSTSEVNTVSLAPAPPESAQKLFADRLDLAQQFAGLLADSGVSHGLIGPREVPRLWERHLLNCAVIHEAIPQGGTVIDVGSGAGLPGIVLAIVRPDLEIHLIEPLLRRTTWLTETLHTLGLTSVIVHRGRAEQFWGELSAHVVTARAVARLSELARWCLPLVAAGGVLLAIKGSSAPQELEDDRVALRALGARGESIRTYGVGVVDPPSTVVRVEVGSSPRTRSRTTVDKKSHAAKSSRASRKRPQSDGPNHPQRRPQ